MQSVSPGDLPCVITLAFLTALGSQALNQSESTISKTWPIVFFILKDAHLAHLCMYMCTHMQITIYTFNSYMLQFPLWNWKLFHPKLPHWRHRDTHVSQEIVSHSRPKPQIRTAMWYHVKTSSICWVFISSRTRVCRGSSATDLWSVWELRTAASVLLVRSHVGMCTEECRAYLVTTTPVPYLLCLSLYIPTEWACLYMYWQL